jgi:hypothetical protein
LAADASEETPFSLITSACQQSIAVTGLTTQSKQSPRPSSPIGDATANQPSDYPEGSLNGFSAPAAGVLSCPSTRVLHLANQKQPFGIQTEEKSCVVETDPDIS